MVRKLDLKFYFVLILFLLFCSFSCFAFTNLKRSVAIVRVLNKQTGKVSDFEIAVGTSKIIDDLVVDIKVCYSRPDDEVEENSLFVEIKELGISLKSHKSIFSGWMFSSSVSLNSLEHPVYDLWILKCK